jgi:geranylgeranyl diphosphate synthase type II
MDRIKHYVSKVEQGLKKLDFKGDPTELYAPIEYFMALGGKRLRPALCLAACELFGRKADEALNPALGIEVFHNFTLVHDDIMDDANVRRGKPTVHEKWNVNTAILSGDTMLVQAYQLIASVGESVLKPVLDTFSKTAIEVCEGQQYDMSFETLGPVKEEDYIEMIRLKTSVLLGAALKIGALTGGAGDAAADKLYAFGVNIGIAFQIQDDLLDAFGNPEKVGKKPGGDIILNKQTILRIHAWYHGHENSRELLTREFDSNENKVTAIRDLFETTGSRAYAEQLRDSFYKEALTNLEEVGGNEEIKRELAQFAEWLILREH